MGFSLGFTLCGYLWGGVGDTSDLPHDSLRGSWGTLPGDGSEQAKADGKTQGGCEEDGPGVGREPGAKGGHDGVSFGDKAMHTK